MGLTGFREFGGSIKAGILADLFSRYSVKSHFLFRTCEDNSDCK